MPKKLSLFQAVLIGSLLIAAAVLYTTTGEKSTPVRETKAEVSGMNYSDLQRDRDFQKAVKYIVENCTVNGYVKGDYLTGTRISCD